MLSFILLTVTVIVYMHYERTFQRRSSSLPLPQGKMQREINRLARRLSNPNEVPGRDAYDELKKLESRHKGHLVDVILQTSLFMNKQSAGSGNEEMYLAGLAILQYLYPKVDKHELISGIVPWLQTEDHDLREILDRILDSVYILEGKESFEPFVPYIRETQESPSPRLVQFMFHTSSEKALDAFFKAYKVGNEKEMEVLSQIKRLNEEIEKGPFPSPDMAKESSARASRIISVLMMSKYWWIRYYAAQVLKEWQVFSTPELIAKINKDPNILVRKAYSEPNDESPSGKVAE